MSAAPLSARAGTTLSESASGELRVAGPLSFDSAGETLLKSQSWLKAGRRLKFNLAGVTRTDSAGLALIVEWVKEVRGCGGDAQFVNVPPQLLALATACGLASLFEG
jgi:phospholipid transport system transporter-binding protein